MRPSYILGNVAEAYSYFRPKPTHILFVLYSAKVVFKYSKKNCESIAIGENYNTRSKVTHCMMIGFVTGISFGAGKSSTFSSTCSQISSQSFTNSSFIGHHSTKRCNLHKNGITAMMMEENIDEQGSFTSERTDEASRIVEETKLFVGNLAWATTDASLEEAFAKFGRVLDVRVITDRESGRSRGFGFIEYEAAGAAEDALAGMDGAELDGRAIRVDRATRRQTRRRRHDDF